MGYLASVEESPTVEEIMVASVARLLPNDGVGFVGVGSGGRAFTLTFGIPVAAAILNCILYDSQFELMLGSAIGPDLKKIPTKKVGRSRVDLRYGYDWPAVARLPALDNMDAICRGRLDVAFVSGAQVDRFGNLNITCVGPHDKPHKRLVGCLAQPELLAFAKQVLIIIDQRRDTFVPAADFITSVGFLEGADTRNKAGLGGGGPRAVVTDRSVLDFDPVSRMMRVRSIHPNVERQEFYDSLGFDVELPIGVRITEPPTVEEVRVIRTQIDPYGILLKGS